MPDIRDWCSSCGFNRPIAKHEERGKKTYNICAYCKDRPESEWLFRPKPDESRPEPDPGAEAARASAIPEPAIAASPPAGAPPRARKVPKVVGDVRVVALQRAADRAFVELREAVAFRYGVALGVVATISAALLALSIALALGWLR